MATFFLNKNSEKTPFDRIRINKKEDSYSVLIYEDLNSMSDVNAKYKAKKYTELNMSQESLIEYVKVLFGFLQNDKDETPILSMDVSIPGFPIVCLNIDDKKNRDRVLRALFIWMKFHVDGEDE